VALLSAAHQQLHAPIILIWDNLNTHLSDALPRIS
jgi:putative transposase